MVFSQTSHKTRSVSKVEIIRLKSEKNQQVGLTKMATEQRVESSPPPSPAANPSFSEELIKSEPEFKSEMFNDSDCEFFQDLVQWCTPPATEEVVVQSTDCIKSNEPRTLYTDTPHTQFSPQGWDVFDANTTHAYAGNTVYTNSLSPVDNVINTNTNINIDTYNTQETFNNYKVPFHEQFLDIGNLPVVIKDLAFETTAVESPRSDLTSITALEHQSTYDTDYTNFTQPFIDQDDSLDAKFLTVPPWDVERNELLTNEFTNLVAPKEVNVDGRPGGLSIDVAARSQPWPDDIINTPEVLSCVEQLEKEKCTLLCPTDISSTHQGIYVDSTPIDNSPAISYQPITPKSDHQIDTDEDYQEKKRRHHDSEDSDETYTPYTETAPRKYKRRKPNIPIKDMIRALEGSQLATKTRRGRPPKRRDSGTSTVSENSSVASTHESKYRELRDKNNEASKRSRMSRKLKELQMEQLADELEERNKILRVRADLLEKTTKKLRDAFMSAVAHKTNS